MACISGILLSEKEAEVRRGGVVVLGMLLRGLSVEVLEIIPQELKSIYQLLKRVESSDPDEVTRFHSVQALKELQLIMQQFLFPNTEVPSYLQM